MFSSKDQIQDREIKEENRKSLEMGLGAREQCAVGRALMARHRERWKGNRRSQPALDSNIYFHILQFCLGSVLGEGF